MEVLDNNFVSDGYTDWIERYKTKVDLIHQPARSLQIRISATGWEDIDSRLDIGGKRIINECIVSEDPAIVQYEKFLTDEEIEAVLRYAENHWEPARTNMVSINKDNIPSYADSATNASKSPSRTNDRASFTDLNRPELIHRLELRAAHIIGVHPQFLEAFNVLRYTEGQYFKLHHDGVFRPYTMLIFLNDVTDGGELVLPCLGLKVKPTKGLAMLFKNVTEDGAADRRLLHAALPPNGGQCKYSVPLFINVKPVNGFHQL